MLCTSLCLLAAVAAGPEGLPLGPEGPLYEVTDPSLALTDEVTLEAWVQADPIPAAGGRILDKITPGGQDGFLLDTWPGNSLRLITAAGQLGFAAQLPADRWSHVVGVYSAAKHQMKLYLNGKEVASRAEGPWPALVANALPLRLGADQNDGNRFVGRVRQAAVYGRALTAEEVARRAADPEAKLPGVLGDWRLAADAGAKVPPVAGTLTLSGPPRFAGQAPPPAEPLSVWLRQPARRWTEALLLGNGRLGAMVFGGVPSEQIALNEDTLWSGGPGHYQNPEALAALPEVRRLVLAGKGPEAHRLTQQKMHGTYNESYQPLGDLHLDFDSATAGDVSDYRRDLNLRTGVVTVSYRQGGARYTREVFTSAVDQVMVVRLSCDQPGGLSVSARLTSQLHGQAAGDGEQLVFAGRAPAHCQPSYQGHAVEYAADRGMRFQMRLAARGGLARVEGDRLVVAGRDSVTLVLAARTSFSGFDKDPLKDGRDEAALAMADVTHALARTDAQLLAAHVADVGGLMDRVSLRLGEPNGNAALPTDERLKAYQPRADPGLAALYYQFGRYLVVSGSRPGTQPLNLQGIWNVSTNPDWSANWTLNCNAQINYWGCEQANLSELHEPLLRMTAELVPDGEKTAREMYAAGGWVAHHNTDLWRGAAPVDGDPVWFIFQVGGAWLCQHLWDHYAYTGDEAYLRRVWPVLRGAAQYFLDTLQPEPTHGWLVDVPATNFENYYRQPDGATAAVCAAPTADVEMIGELFGHVARASELLGLEPELRAKVAAARSKLPPLQISPRTGELQEWLADWDHASRDGGQMLSLWGLICGTSIDRRRTPELAAATHKTMLARKIWEPYGGTASSWVGSFAANGFARLGDGANAAMVLDRHLSRSLHANLTAMFGGMSAFQIDGNLGQMAGIGAMLLQSSEDEIELLPALPPTWTDGEVKGLCARGGFTVDLAWHNGKLTEATLHSRHGLAAKVRYGEQVHELRCLPGESERWRPGAG